MTTPAKKLILNEIKIEQNALEQAITLWKAANEKNPNKTRGLYVSGNDVLEITAQDENFQFDECMHSSPLLEVEKKLKSSLLSDWKRQALVLIDIAKPQPYTLPNAPYLQLRHIEVPLSVYNDYIEWRKATIFAYVKTNTKVDSFLAYHSVFSAEPGVTFLSSFSCDPETYSSSFNTPAYQKIIQDAGNKYICGGEKSLYTKIYRKV